MKGFKEARAAYEAQMPDEDPEEGCDHKWKFLGEADGECFYICKKCGEEGSI